MTYPDADRYIPAPLSLLTGWCGPVEWSANPGPWRRGVWGYIGESSGAPVEGLATAGDGHDRGYVYRLDPTRPEVQALLLRWLATGEACRGCKGTRCQPSPVAFDPDDPCDLCDGTGYFRPPAPAHHLAPAWMGGWLPEWQAAGVVACVAARAAAGLPVISKLYGEWQSPQWSDVVTMRRALHLDGKRAGPMVGHYWHDGGWILQPDEDPYNQDGVPHGPETGAAGRDKADACALANGCALVDGDALLLPYPDGPKRWAR